MMCFHPLWNPYYVWQEILLPGEAQKIAIARALHKNAPFLALDRRTAAPDPALPEYEVHRSNAISGGKTALISATGWPRAVRGMKSEAWRRMSSTARMRRCLGEKIGEYACFCTRRHRDMTILCRKEFRKITK